jgi:uncharacterized protein YndB with AHSA1/START domain
MTDNSPETSKKKNLIISRVFDAPVELVWQAWTRPEHVMRWWGPKYFTSPSCKMDFRVGGVTLVCMRSPQGQDLYNTWTYTKIVPMKRIEFIQKLSDKDGQTIDPLSIGVRADFPKEVPTVITFKAVGDKTELTIAEYGFPDSQMFEFAKMGMEQCLDKMAESFK